MVNLPSFLIAGTHSGCGKTTVTLGLMAALTRRGLRVQPFKVGPDFIDPGHHSQVTGRESHNLDGWMLDRRTSEEIFARSAEGADVVVVEGVMGLFDGFSGRDEAGSAAQMAKWLGLPVLLVVDARSMARSAAAVVKGFAEFDPGLELAGVIFNRVGSHKHREILNEAVQGLDGPPIVGFLPRDESLSIPSRHLGLVTVEDASTASMTSALSEWVESNVDLDRLLERVEGASTPGRPGSGPDRAVKARVRDEVRIGVARDRAFCFYYPENLRLLEQSGAAMVFFSPLKEKKLPEDIQGLYLGGGYPELHARTLSENRKLIRDIRRFALDGGPIYAECGGFMVLMKSIQDPEGRVFPMADLFPFRSRMQDRLKALGYRQVETMEVSLLGPAGTRVRGHEFHYSSIVSAEGEVPTLYSLEDRSGSLERTEGYRFNNVLGSYIHLHFGSNPDAASHFVDFCRSPDGKGA